MSADSPKLGQQHEHELDRYAHLVSEAEQVKGVSLGLDAWRRLRHNRAAMISILLLGVLVVLAVLTPLLPLQSPRKQYLKHRRFLGPTLTAPSLGLVETLDEESKVYRQEVEELFGSQDVVDRAMIRARIAIFGDRSIGSLAGTDHLGRDLLARLFWGARISLMVGLVATLVSLVIGVSYGAIAGYLGGWADNAMMRFVDILYSIPFLFLVIFVITILKDEQIAKWLDRHHISQIMVFFVLIGAIFWLTMARVVRGQVISLKNEQFIDAARTIGANRPRIIFRHLVPNLISIAVVYLTLTIPSVMLFEAFLSFLGLGVEPPNVSWGLLANEGIKEITPVRTRWWLVVFPGLALALTLLALNFLGDGLRDALDPRMKNR